MYGNIIQSQFVSALNWPMGSLMSLVMLLLMLIILGALSRFAYLLPLEEAK